MMIMTKHKQIDWQKLWKQRDKALETLEYHRIGKSMIKQASTLIIGALFEKSTKWHRMRTAKVKVRGYVFGFHVNYGVGWGDKKSPSIKTHAYCDDEYKENSTLVRALVKEFNSSFNKLFNQIDELTTAFMLEIIR